MVGNRFPAASRQPTRTDCPWAAELDRAGPQDHHITSGDADLRIHKESGGDPAAPVVLEELGGASLQPGRFLLVSRATLDRLRGEGGRS
jgi:hypothetical protein